MTTSVNEDNSDLQDTLGSQDRQRVGNMQKISKKVCIYKVGLSGAFLVTMIILLSYIEFFLPALLHNGLNTC